MVVFLKERILFLITGMTAQSNYGSIDFKVFTFSFGECMTILLLLNFLVINKKRKRTNTSVLPINYIF